MAVDGVMHVQQRQRDLIRQATVVVEVVSSPGNRLVLGVGLLIMRLGAWVAGFADFEVIEDKS